MKKAVLLAMLAFNQGVVIKPHTELKDKELLRVGAELLPPEVHDEIA